MPKANERQVGGTHYKTGTGVPEHWDLAIMYHWDPFQYQITKYVMRWKDKGGVNDLEKAAHFLQKYIESADKFIPPAAAEPTSLDDVWDKVSGHLEQFLFEGSKEGMNHYRCRRCKEFIMAKNPLRAFEQHGDCASPNYVNQDR